MATLKGTRYSYIKPTKSTTLDQLLKQPIGGGPTPPGTKTSINADARIGTGSPTAVGSNTLRTVAPATVAPPANAATVANSLNAPTASSTTTSLGGIPSWNQGTTDPLSGPLAGYGYTPAGAGTIYDNPQSLASDVLASLGINNPGLANSLANSLDPAVAAQFLLTHGMNASDDKTLNFVNEYLQQLSTPGGRSVQFDSLINNLLGAGDAQSSPLGAYLNASLDPSQQVQAANALLGQTLVGLNPYAQQGYSRFAKDAGSQYQTALAKGNGDYSSYIDYLNSTPLRMWANR